MLPACCKHAAWPHDGDLQCPSVCHQCRLHLRLGWQQSALGAPSHGLGAAGVCGAGERVRAQRGASRWGRAPRCQGSCAEDLACSQAIGQSRASCLGEPVSFWLDDVLRQVSCPRVCTSGVAALLSVWTLPAWHLHSRPLQSTHVCFRAPNSEPWRWGAYTACTASECEPSDIVSSMLHPSASL